MKNKPETTRAGKDARNEPKFKQQNATPRPRRWPMLMVLALLLGLLSLISLLPEFNEDFLKFLRGPGVNPEIFILLMLTLPIFGLPIIPFLVLAGIMFGPFAGSGITALIISLHLSLSYLLTHSFLLRQISRLLARMNYQIPKIHPRHRLLFAFLFMALPGLPYTVKNFTLAILNIPFLMFFPVALICNVALALPFIFFGSSIFADPKIAILLIAILAAGYVFSLRLKRL